MPGSKPGPNRYVRRRDAARERSTQRAQQHHTARDPDAQQGQRLAYAAVGIAGLIITGLALVVLFQQGATHGSFRAVRGLILLAVVGIACIWVGWRGAILN